MNTYLVNNKANHPLQTTYWADFRSEWGNKVEIDQFGLITIHKIPLINKYIGILEKGPKPTKDYLINLSEYMKNNNLLFIKLEPNYIPRNGSDRNKLIKLLIERGCLAGKTLFTPTTFLIDLSRSDEEMLSSFHPKTRYNIKYAARKGVLVNEDNSDKAFSTYLKLTFETARRQGFYAHSERYHRLMWKHLHTKMVEKNLKPIARLLTAKYNGKTLTTWIVFVWKDHLYYPYGASSSEMQNLQPNSAMMWGAISYGKKLGLKTFDLWGREQGKGFTRFKEGFNPRVVEFLGSWDMVNNRLIYYTYRTLEKFRWTFLRLIR